MAAFQFYLQLGKQRKVGWVGQLSCCFWLKNSLVKKVVWDGKLLWCSSPFVVKVRGHGIFRKRSTDVEENYDKCSWLCSSPVSPFPVSASLSFLCTAHTFFPKLLSNHCQGLSLTFSEICTTFDSVPLQDPSWNHNRPHTRLQTKGRKNQHVHPTAWNCVHRLLTYASTIIYCCIALQLLYRWQHQFRKLWISPCSLISRFEPHPLGRAEVFYNISQSLQLNVSHLKVRAQRICLLVGLQPTSTEVGRLLIHCSCRQWMDVVEWRACVYLKWPVAGQNWNGYRFWMGRKKWKALLKLIHIKDGNCRMANRGHVDFSKWPREGEFLRCPVWNYSWQPFQFIFRLQWN
jgi:hypothetical protein